MRARSSPLLAALSPNLPSPPPPPLPSLSQPLARYNCGKVCLSLLGTWAGPGWVPGTSTLYQVLLSIQSLILNRCPIENEPSFEAPTPQACAANPTARTTHMLRALVYNCEVRLATLLHGILDPLRSLAGAKGLADKFFASAMALHFSHKRGEIAAQAVLWCEEAVLLARFAFAVEKLEFARAQGGALPAASQAAAAAAAAASAQAPHTCPKLPPHLCPLGTPALSADGAPPHPGAAILRPVLAGGKSNKVYLTCGGLTCELCGGRYKQCYGGYGWRSSAGVWAAGVCPGPPQLEARPESPNPRWCSSGCEARYRAFAAAGGKAGGGAQAAAAAPPPQPPPQPAFTTPALMDLASRAAKLLVRPPYPTVFFAPNNTLGPQGVHPGGLFLPGPGGVGAKGPTCEQDLAAMLARLRVSARGVIERAGGGSGNGGGEGEGAAKAPAAAAAAAAGASRGGGAGSAAVGVGAAVGGGSTTRPGGPLRGGGGGDDSASQRAALARSTADGVLFPFYLAWSTLVAAEAVVGALSRLPSE